MAGKGDSDKYISHQIRPPRQGTQTVRLPRAVQQQNRKAPPHPHGQRPK